MATIVSRFTGIFLLLFWAVPAYAGVVDEVNNSPMRVGAFLLTPKLIVEQQYNSNIFASQNNEKSDFITVLKPSVTVEKSIRDHHFTLNAGSEVFRYWDHNSEDVKNYNARLDSRLTARRDLILPFSLSYDLGHRERNRELSPTQSTEPLAFQTYNAEAGAEYQPNRMFFGLYGRYTARRYDNGHTSSGAPVIREDGDSDTYSGKLALRYETKREWQPFASLTVSHNDFQRRSFNGTSFSGVARDNTFYRALAGLAFKYKGLISGNVAIGKDWRHYTDDDVSNISATGAEGLIEWSPTAKTALTLNISRATDEENELNESIIETKAGLLLNHELQSDLFLRARTEYENKNFGNSDREDDFYTGSAGVYYVISPRLQVGADVAQRMRESNRTGSDFDQTLFTIRLTGSL